jgi:hypothetical protein
MTTHGATNAAIFAAALKCHERQVDAKPRNMPRSGNEPRGRGEKAPAPSGLEPQGKVITMASTAAPLTGGWGPLNGTNWRTIVGLLLTHANLNAWERGFLPSIVRMKELTQAQKSKLYAIVLREHPSSIGNWGAVAPSKKSERGAY